MRKFDLPLTKAVRENLGGTKPRRDYFTIGTAAEFAAEVAPRYWNTHDTGDIRNRIQAAEVARTGYLPSVKLSDKFLDQVEHLFPAPTTRHEIRDDVTGAFPNVPAYIAGQPLSMRRKIKRENEFSPIAIVADLVSSGGIASEKLLKRGAAILALARALSARRPVELWAGCSMEGMGGGACHVYFQIDTQPLDLARAAYMLAHPAFSRGNCYGMGKAEYRFGGGWPYNRRQDDATMADVVRRAFPHLSDIIYVPGIYITDECIDDPIGWITRHVAAYGEQAPEG